MFKQKVKNTLEEFWIDFEELLKIYREKSSISLVGFDEK